MDDARRDRLRALMTNYVQLTPTGPYKFTIVESRAHTTIDAVDGRASTERRVGFRENMDIKFLRPHEIVVSSDTGGGGVHAVANGSEAKIADSMLRALHAQGIIADAATDLRFSMRPGGNPGVRDYGGVFEAFTARGSGTIELRKRLAFADLGGKSLSSMEYITDGGRAGDGSAEGGVVRLLDDVPLLHAVLSTPARGAPRYGRLTLDTRDDLDAPGDAARDVLVIDFAGFESESFGTDSASRIVSAATRLGWRAIVGYGFIGGPRYVGTNLEGPGGAAAASVVIELYGRAFGDFLVARPEGG